MVNPIVSAAPMAAVNTVVEMITDNPQLDSVADELAVEMDDMPEAPPVADESSYKRLLTQFRSRCRSAATSTLDMGRLASAYIDARMSYSPDNTRAVCIRSLASAWEEEASDPITIGNVSQLVRTWHTFALLKPDVASKAMSANKLSAKDVGVSLRVIREFSPLATRNDEQRLEVWTWTQETTAAALDLWERFQAKPISGEAIKSAVGVIMGKPVKVEAPPVVAAPVPSTPVSPSAILTPAVTAPNTLQAWTDVILPSENPPRISPTTKPHPVEALRETAKVATAKDYAAMLMESALLHASASDVVSILLTSIIETMDATEAGCVLAEQVEAHPEPDDVFQSLCEGLATEGGALSKPARHVAREAFKSFAPRRMSPAVVAAALAPSGIESTNGHLSAAS